jgi:hypothetical protein
MYKNHLFLITSAINTKFGIHSREERLEQTKDTVKSIIKRIPDAKIVIIESSGEPIGKEIQSQLEEISSYVINFSENEAVQKIYNSTPNWDLVKSACELLCFKTALDMLEDTDIFENIDRVHKMSGRYQLNNDFDIDLYENKKIIDKLVFAKPYHSQFKSKTLPKVTIPIQFMSRLWSWPIFFNPIVKDFYAKAVKEFEDRTMKGEYVDVEHLLYYLLPKEIVFNVEKIGVEGRLGAIEHLVQD